VKGRIAFVVAAVGVLGVASHGRAATSPPNASLRADVAEWSVVPSVGVVSSGRTRIVVRNLGAQLHQLMVVRVRTFGAQLPLRGSRAVARPVGAAVTVRPGATVSFTVSLRPGSYLLVDNLPWHYWHGTSAAFAVR
jgi:uncharacterized cupredoxin-like copper-binding protein